jgi:hypothetical protein
MRRRKLRTLIAYLAVTAALLHGCKKAAISGRVIDLFGQPVAGATITIPKTAFTATSDAAGRYSLSYAPGQFEVHVAKATYTSATVPWNVTESTALPSADITLYPNPEKPGIYYVGKDRLELLTAKMITRSVSADTFTTTRVYSFTPGLSGGPTVPAGAVTFLDTRKEPFSLFRGAPGTNTFFRVTYLMGAPDVKLNGETKTVMKEVGDEKVQLETVTLDARNGNEVYGWIPMPVEAAQLYYPFTVHAEATNMARADGDSRNRR